MALANHYTLCISSLMWRCCSWVHVLYKASCPLSSGSIVEDIHTPSALFETLSTLRVLLVRIHVYRRLVVIIPHFGLHVRYLLIHLCFEPPRSQDETVFSDASFFLLHKADIDESSTTSNCRLAVCIKMRQCSVRNNRRG